MPKRVKDKSTSKSELDLTTNGRAEIIIGPGTHILEQEIQHSVKARMTDMLIEYLNRKFNEPRDERGCYIGLHKHPEKRIVPEGSWGYIPWRDHARIAILADLFSQRCAQHDPPQKFLEIGCGCGAVSAAFRAGWRYPLVVHGIEIQKPLADFAVATGWVDKIVCDDAFKFENYSDYDYLFIYQPIRQERKAIELTKKIIEGMKIGAFIMGDALPGQRYIHEHLAPVNTGGAWCKTRQVEFKAA